MFDRFNGIINGRSILARRWTRIGFRPAGLIFLYYGGSRSRRRPDPEESKTLRQYYFNPLPPPPFPPFAVADCGGSRKRNCFHNQCHKRKRKREGGGKDPFFSWREILLLPTTLNLLFIIRGIIKRREGRNRLGLIRPCNDRSIDLLISPSDDEENSTPYPVYTLGRGWVRLRGEEGNRFWTRNWILLLVWPRNAKFLWSKEFSRSLLLLLFFPLTLDPAHGLLHPLLSPR